MVGRLDGRTATKRGGGGVAAGSNILTEVAPRSHVVKFYDDAEDVAETMARFLADGVQRGEGLVVVATTGRWPVYRDALIKEGVDVARLEATERLMVLNAEETLARIVPGDTVDGEAFDDAVGHIITQVLDRGVRHIRLFGEMVDLLWQSDRLTAALDLEARWNRVLKEQPVTILCGYRMGLLCGDGDTQALEHVCAVHSHVLLAEDRARLDRAVAAALDDVLGAERAGTLAPLIRANNWSNSSLGDAERTVFWVGRNLPWARDRLLARARHHLHA